MENDFEDYEGNLESFLDSERQENLWHDMEFWRCVKKLGWAFVIAVVGVRVLIWFLNLILDFILGYG